MPDPARCAVLVSGSGTNLQSLLEDAASGTLGAEITAVVSDRANAPALDRAREYGADARFLDPAAHADRVDYDQELARVLSGYHPDLIVLAGFMRVLSPELVARFPGRLINVHPSLLPAFRGLDTHRRALEAGCRIHGTTVHFVSEELDSGPIIAQGALAVRDDDDPASLAMRVKALEHRLLPQVVRWFASGGIEVTGGNVKVRVPETGESPPELIVPAPGP